MTTQTEALKMALEALERIDLWLKARYSGIGLVGVELEAITAIKEALAQPELCKYGQEPKSCTSSPMDCQCALDATLAQPEQDKERCVGCEACIDTACGRDECPKGWSKAPQRTWVGLTDDEIEEIFNKSAGYGRDDFRSFAKSIESKLKEKNT